jgi:hypothetical protein
MLKDLRLAGRMILQSKGWTVVVLLSLAIGIGANAALFNAINGLLLKEVPVRDPETLVRLRWVGRNDMVTSSSDYGFTGKDAQGRNVRSTFSYPMFQQFVAENRTLTDLAAFAPFGRINVVVDGQAEIATSFISSGNYYRMLGVTASLGRTIEPDDDRPTAPPVALVSHKFWRSRFGSSPSGSFCAPSTIFEPSTSAGPSSCPRESAADPLRRVAHRAALRPTGEPPRDGAGRAVGRAVAAALLAGSVNSTSIFVQGRTYSADQHDSINRVVVSPGFFDTMEMPLRAGRGFTSRDSKGAPKVAVINEAAARQYFPNQDPLGQRFGSSLENNADLEIVGILRDAKYNSVRDAPPPTMYVPYQQARLFGATLELRTAGDPSRTMSAVREAIRQVDSNLPLLDTTTQMEQVEQRFLQEKVFAQAYLLFGGLALLLASIGLFGLMSYSVRRRTNEIGIRMALGAQRRDVLRMVLGESMLLVILGVGIGVGVALAISRYVASLLFGLPPTDVMSMALAIAVMLLVSAVAGYLPALHASRVDPMVAVRTE